MKNNKLKPCPFCGGEAVKSRSGAKYMVFCKGCLVQTQAFVKLEDATTVWNHRTVPEIVISQSGNSCTIVENVGTLNL